MESGTSVPTVAVIRTAIADGDLRAGCEPKGEYIL